ncbi:putative SET domain containing protein [Leishmania naiffi]|uniref:SET domain containing protein n=1 Tax=Leishmania naiffi TaxID=5678 RepID=A0AAW3B5Z4_9TRYP
MRRAPRLPVLCTLPLHVQRWRYSTPAPAPGEALPLPSTKTIPQTEVGASKAPPPATSSGAPHSGSATDQHRGADAPYRSLYPRVKLRATTQERPYKQRDFVTFEEAEGGNGQGPPSEGESVQVAPLSSATAESSSAAVSSDHQCSHTPSSLAAQAESRCLLSNPMEGNEVQQFLDEAQRQVDVARHARNQAIPFPQNPGANSPEFRRIKRHAKMKIEVPDPDYPTFARKDQAIQLPPPQEHPWVRKNTPIGPFILHGDGQIHQTGGTGQVDFDDNSVNEKLPKSYRGLQHRSTLQRRLPQDNGRVLQEALIKHSFTLTGRGVFATRRIAKGETIMIVQSTARNVGVKGELQRLEEMCTDILIACRDGDVRACDYLHDWVLTGQPSSLVEHWPASSTLRVMDAIGGADVLDALELHPIHIARMAAIIDLNSFLVESSISERRGMAYFPEAGFLNHSCAPNATYDIMPEHVFRDTDYYLDEATRTTAAEAGDEEKSKSPATATDDASTSSAAEGDISASQVAVRNGVSQGQRNVAVFDSEDNFTAYPDLTEADAPVYLFCCRAEKDIEVGEEIVISYVPPQWSFDNRQYVLHDRYRFWCKCPKCSPVLDKKYARVPKLIVAMVMVSIALQLMVFRQRNLKNLVDEDYKRLAAMSEEERLEELRARGIDVEAMAADAVKRRKQRRVGLFEMLEEERLNRLYEPENRGPMNIVNRMDAHARPPR